MGHTEREKEDDKQRSRGEIIDIEAQREERRRKRVEIKEGREGERCETFLI